MKNENGAAPATKFILHSSSFIPLRGNNAGVHARPAESAEKARVLDLHAAVHHRVEPAFARAGKAVVFSSTANNLDRGDSNGTVDVYERTFTRYYAHIKGKGVQSLKMDSRLVSASGGRAAIDSPRR